MDQSKDVLETEIEELWKFMMKQSMMREMAVRRMINHNLNLIEKKRKMKQKTSNIQQQQRCKVFRELQTKVSDPGGFLSTHKDT